MLRQRAVKEQESKANNLSAEDSSKKRKQTGNYSDYETDEGY